MSTKSLPAQPTPKASGVTRRDEAEAVPSLVQELTESLSSLSLTVWLFSLTIFLVLAGTLAQVEKDIWQVVDEYFRTFITWIDFQLFVPPSFFPDTPQLQGGFYFPGGWTLGILLGVNLIAAHSVRFRPQARGMRLVSGLVLIATGILITCLVIASGSGSDGLQAVPVMSWAALWNVMLCGLAVFTGGLIFAGYRMGHDRRSARRLLIGCGAAAGGLLLWFLIQGESARLNDSSLRILWQLAKGTVAGLILLGGCVLVFRKRGGVVLLHAGVGLLMFSELMVGLTAEENRMAITEGQTVNYVESLRRLELAIVDRSDPEHDEVISVPHTLLTTGQLIRDAELPFDIRVEAWFRNAELSPAVPNGPNPATTGLGREWVAHERPPLSGTDTQGRINEAAAYLTFLDKQTAEPLGTHLVSLQQSAIELPEKVVAGDDTYKVYLRFRRTYQPWTISLLDVRKVDYLGTSTPRDYSSEIRLVDETRGEDRVVRVWMNNPLRFAGETFYQSGYHRDPQSGVETTTLQVVTNTGWMIPYVACMLVATGMLAHFGVVLLRFLQRRESSAVAGLQTESATNGLGEAVTGERDGRAWWKRPAVVVPAALVTVLAVWIAGKARIPQPPATEPDLYEFGRIPIVFQGRAKPMDTLARNTLRILSDRQTFVDQDGVRRPAVHWLLDVIARPERAADHRIFRIENPEVLQTLGVEPREGFRYAWSEVEDRIDDLTRQAALARSLEASRLSTYQKKLLQAEQKLAVYDLLVQSLRPPQVRRGTEQEAMDLRIARQSQQMLAQRSPPLVIPPAASDGIWTTWSAAELEASQQKDQPSGSAQSVPVILNRIRDAWAAGDVAGFNAGVAEAHAAFAVAAPSQTDFRRISFESFFNHFEPFYQCAVLYVLAFVLTAVSWLGFSRPLNRAAFWLVMLTFGIHTLALIGRIYISGRPPVTNLYSSAVFIGWGAVLLGILFERFYQIGVGNVISSVTGFATLLIAHFLAGNGDTFAVLQAVLDTQFWLATHVVCITLGYATTYVAGLLGILYILRGVVTPTLSTDRGRDLLRMIYGTLCFATFFSFVGTVLGGLWADDSWGRFWGWDPKENGALIIVLWNALVLHARWGNLVRGRGMAVLAVGGNIAVSWSWFGVNELGVGLHSYGFTEGVLRALGMFVLSQLVIILIGSLPLHWWWSVRRQSTKFAAET